MTTPTSAQALARPRLDHLLAAARTVRLTTVIAPAGYGKTTLLADWAARVPVAWHAVTEQDRSPQVLLAGLVAALRTALPELGFDPPTALADDDAAGAAGRTNRAHAMAAALCEAVSAVPPRSGDPLLLVLDDAHLIDPTAASRELVEALCLQAPPGLRVVLAGRTAPPFPVLRLRGRSEVLEVTAAQLAFAEQETARLLGDPARAAAVHRATGGWPVAVRMVAEALRREPAPAWSADLPHDRALYDYLAHEIFEREPHPVRELLAVVALFERCTPELLAALGFADAERVLTGLVDRGLFVERLVSAPGWFGLIPLAKVFVSGRFPLDGPRLRSLVAAAAEWFATHGHLAEAFAALAALPDREPVRRLLVERGEQLLHSGGTDTLLAAVELMPSEERDPALWQMAGAAHHVRGEWGRALACLQRAAEHTDRTAPALALRVAAIHYFSGAPDDALLACGRCAFSGSDPAAESGVRSIAASAHWARGDVAVGRAEVGAAMDLARESGDDAALAAAHTVLAMIADAEGDRVAIARHYELALTHARLAGDVLAETRIRVNRAAHFVHEADHRAALTELDTALRLAELTGFTSYRALALNNRGAALLALGRLDEAAADLQAARTVYTRTGSRLASLALESLGEIHRLRGDRVQAEVALTEAARLAEENDAAPQLVPALAGLATVLAEDDPAAAGEAVRRALARGTGFGYPLALLAAARVALARGDRAEAAARAEEARAVAARRGDRAALAESLTLIGRAHPDRDQALVALDQAGVLWREIGNPLGDIAVATARAAVLGGADGRAMAEVAAQAARRAGALGLATRAEAVAQACLDSGQPAVSVQTLGGFRVLRGGEPVPATAWQSRKARDLLKILVSRRGRPTSREVLMAMLWPDEPPQRVANRFSVALSTARLVLDPRRGDRHGIVADADQVRLDPAVVEVDVLRFLADAQAGLAGRGRQPMAAAPLLAAAEARYAGDFLEEEPYADWAAELRADARLTYLQVASALAEEAEAGGEHVAAGRYCLRVLERDRYDETAHLTLVRTLAAQGGHGEARRRYRAYVARMREIGVEPRPFPGPTPVHRSR